MHPPPPRLQKPQLLMRSWVLALETSRGLSQTDRLHARSHRQASSTNAAAEGRHMPAPPLHPLHLHTPPSPRGGPCPHRPRGAGAPRPGGPCLPHRAAGSCLAGAARLGGGQAGKGGREGGREEGKACLPGPWHRATFRTRIHLLAAIPNPQHHVK